MVAEPVGVLGDTDDLLDAGVALPAAVARGSRVMTGVTRPSRTPLTERRHTLGRPRRRALEERSRVLELAGHDVGEPGGHEVSNAPDPMASITARVTSDGGRASRSASEVSLSGRWNSSVSMTPGLTTCSCTPVPHRSIAIDSENAVSAALEAL